MPYIKSRLPTYFARRVLPEKLSGRIDLQVLFSLLVMAVLAGCSIPMAGLHPEYPPAEKGTFALWTDYVKVDSLQPMLRWQPFPRPEDVKADKSGNLNRIQEISYEVRVWKTITGSSGELVYARSGLTSARHQLEEPLKPATKYLWSVRARFVLDGYPRVTEWGLAGFLLQGEVVPNPSCYRFKTAKNQE